MQRIMLTVPTKIYYGKDILEAVLLKSNLPSNILLITGKVSTIKFGFVNRVLRALPDRNIKVFNKVSANPKVSEIDAAIHEGEGCEAVIGLGGGSAIDAAKVVAAGIGMGKYTEDYLLSGVVPDESTLPIIAIPTTAGTGSELSKGAIVSDDKRKIKTGIRGEKLFPSIAIVDSALTYTVPEKVTMETGFDVFAHAVESMISLNANEFSRMLSKEVISNVGIYLPRLKMNLEDYEARDKMSYYSMLMGINVGNIGNVLPHRLQYPIGAHTDTSHGAGLAALYRSWIMLTYYYSSECFDLIFSLLSQSEVKGKESVLSAYDDFMAKLGLNNITIQSLGLKEKDIAVLEQEVSGDLKSDPASVEKDIIQRIYQESLRRN